MFVCVCLKDAVPRDTERKWRYTSTTRLIWMHRRPAVRWLPIPRAKPAISSASADTCNPDRWAFASWLRDPQGGFQSEHDHDIHRNVQDKPGREDRLYRPGVFVRFKPGQRAPENPFALNRVRVAVADLDFLDDGVVSGLQATPNRLRCRSTASIIMTAVELYPTIMRTDNLRKRAKHAVVTSEVFP